MLLVCCQVNEFQASATTELTTAQQIHSLTYAQSLERLPVHLRRAQVLYYNPTLGNLFVRDSTRGVYVDMRGQPTQPLHSGDLLEISGMTGPGGYAPVVEHARIRILGKVPLPPAPRFSLDHLLTGVEDCQWVEVTGIVRSVEESKHIVAYANQAAAGGTTVQVILATGAGRLDVIVREPEEVDYARLVDAKVAVRGVSGPRFNQQRQLTGIHLFAQSLAQFRVLQRGPADPFSLPVSAFNTVMRYSPDNVPEHRIRVQGVVTANQNRTLLSLASGGFGLFVHTTDAHDVRVGDLLDVAGFPAMGDYTPVLEDVVYRKMGTGPQPEPVRITPEDMFRGGSDARLVRVGGRLLMHTRSLREDTFLVAAGERTFSAVLSADRVSEGLSSLREGSIIEFTGTCFVEVFPNKTPKSVQILLRSPQDIVVVQRASWWTVAHTITALAVLCGAVVVALAWITLLRRRVRKQTKALRVARAEADAIGDLARAMQEVAVERKFTTRVSTEGGERIAQLGISFNKMLAELESGESAKRQAEARLQQQALTDELTGLPNRRLLADRISQALALAKREKCIVALLYIDLDGFKMVNDSLGHTLGDVLLEKVAQRLRPRIRESDTLARVGGDEFTVLLNHLHASADAQKVAEGLLGALARQFTVEGHEIVIGASIGISLFPEHGADATTLLQQADGAMYAAKRAGKNRTRIFTPELGTEVRERLTLETQLRGAISRGEIYIDYQPEFDVLSHRLVRFEALARWKHPTLGAIAPEKFIPIAEESGQIITLGAYLLEQACGAAVKWQTAAGFPVQVAVNVSSLQFMLPTFVDEIGEILLYSRLRPELLQIELTESIMLSGAERAAETMHELRSLGVSLAIDDFGTGYSCLSYLPRLPFNTLKIDRSFVRELGLRAGARAIVRSLVTLAHSLQMRVIVEGVETAEELEAVKELGVNEVQGFLLGLPTPHPELLLAKPYARCAPAATAAIAKPAGAS